MARSKKFKQNDNNLAIAYYRFSSHSQNEASIDQQRELAHAWADAHGLTIVRGVRGRGHIRHQGRPTGIPADAVGGRENPSEHSHHVEDRPSGSRQVRAGDGEEGNPRRGMRDTPAGGEHPDGGTRGNPRRGIDGRMAEYYSRQLSQNIQRGMDYNAQHALFNGHKVWGYGVDRETKKYVVDEDTAPFVQRMFAEYAAGKAMQEICDEFNAQGLRTTRGAEFGVKTMTKMLKNRAYIGEYHHGDIVVPDGMPALIDVNTFDEVQARFALNKRKGSQRARGMDDAEAPRYWLTGKLFCGKCGASMQGVHGTSGTGRKYYYYYCKDQRAKQCDKKKMRKEQVEELVTILLRGLLENPENLASLAVDAATYYRDNYRNTHYLDGLEAKRREVEKSTANLLKVIEKAF